MGAPLAALSLFLMVVSTTMPFAVTKSWEITVCSHPVSGNTLNRNGVPICGVATMFISGVCRFCVVYCLGADLDNAHCLR